MKKYTFDLKRFEQYNKFKDKINGEYDSKALNPVLETINLVHNYLNLKGNIAQLGTGEGIFSIPLALIAKPEEDILNFDIFSKKQHEIDNSGYSEFPKLKKNIETLLNRVFRIFFKDVRAMKPKNYLDLTKERNDYKFRIFSIDACHFKQAVLNDLQNGKSVLDQRGIIIIDDYFNHKYPGIKAAVDLFLFKNKDILPFFVGSNKMMLCYSTYHKLYHDAISQVIPENHSDKPETYSKNTKGNLAFVMIKRYRLADVW